MYQTMKRKAYDEMMKWKANHNTALLLRGPRQTGKTFLMKLFSKEYASSLYINIEDEPAVERIFRDSRDPDEIYTQTYLLQFLGSRSITIILETIILFFLCKLFFKKDKIKNWKIILT